MPGLPGLPHVPSLPAAPTASPVAHYAANAAHSARHADAAIDHFGSWEDAMHHLGKGTGDAAALDPASRTALMDALVARRRAIVDQLGRYGAQPVKTASAERGSDVDLNVSGDDAGFKVVQATAFLDANHPGWQRRYRMSIMMHADRTQGLSKAMQSLPATTRKEISRRQSASAEALLVAREARGAETPEARAEILNRIGDPELRTRAQWLAGLDAESARVERNRWLVTSDRAVAGLDPNAPSNARARQIEEAMDAQMMANALDPEAYLSPGAVRGVVLKKSLTPNEQYQAVMEQIGMLQHGASEAGGMRAALRRYETFKYVQRIIDHLAASGAASGATDLAKIKFLRNQAELIYKVDRAAASSARERTVGPEDLASRAAEASVRYDDLGRVSGVSDQHLAEFYGMLQGLLDSHLPTLRSRALGPQTGPGPVPVRLPALEPVPGASPPGPHATPAADATPEALAKRAREQVDEGARLMALSTTRGRSTPGNKLEAEAVLMAERNGRLKPADGNVRRTERDKGEPDLDFAIEDPKTGKVAGYVVIKAPVDPRLRPLATQAEDIALKVSAYESDVQVIVDLKNLHRPDDKAAFRSELSALLQKKGLDLNRVIILNQ